MDTNNKISPSDKLHKNYIRIAKLIHPDLNPNDPNANSKFQELQDAYQKSQNLLEQYQANISITLKEAIEGCERFFITGNEQPFSLLIPKGVQHKQIVIFKNININSVKNCEIHVKVFISVPPQFKLIGNRLILTEYVPFWRLFLGGKYIISDPLDRKISINIPKKTKNGKMFQIKNAGLWNRIDSKRDNLFIQFFYSIF